MNTKESFKNFVKAHPILLKHVKEGKETWQHFYEIYDIYGEDNEAWKDYLTVSTVTSFDLISFLKSLDLDSVQESINSVQRVLGLLQDMSSSNKNVPKVKPRPIYKHFDD